MPAAPIASTKLWPPSGQPAGTSKSRLRTPKATRDREQVERDRDRRQRDRPQDDDQGQEGDKGDRRDHQRDAVVIVWL